MTPLAQAVSSALVQFVWQGFLLLFVVSALAFLLRKHSPNVRYLLYCAALVVVTVLPIATAVALYDPASSNSPSPPAITLTIRAVWNGSVSPFAGFADKWLSQPQPWILRVWLLGVAFLSLRLAWLASRVSSLRRSGGPPDRLILAIANALARRMGMDRAVRILVSAIPDGPSVIGWFRPVILLPSATILNLTPDQLEAILAHEIAHLRRYDDIVNIAQAVIETLLFYHPAVWWISNRIRHERELCCDDLAVRAAGNALGYARALTALERLRAYPPELALGAAASPLEYRIRRIVGARNLDYMPRGLPGLLAFGLTMVCLATYSGTAHGSAPVQPPLVRYPESARLRGIQGTVPVQVQIDNVGAVSAAKAIGGPRELRQAAVESASAIRFAPETVPGTGRVDVVYELTAPESAPATSSATPAPALTSPATHPASVGALNWRDKGEAVIGLAAGNEKDPAKQLELLREWEREYPISELRAQRSLLTGRALLALLGAAYGKTDQALLDAGRKAGQQLVDHFGDYFGDSLRPSGTTQDQWTLSRKNSELQIHLVLAYIARIGMDDATAEAELKKVLEVDPEDAETSYQLGATIMREMAAGNELARWSEAIYDVARALTVTGPTALAPEMKTEAENVLLESYGNYHGSTDGLAELMTLVGASALPPADFHIVSATELNEPVRKAHAEWAAAHPDLDLWEITRTGLLEHGDSYFAEIRDRAMEPLFQATVVSQLSSNRILVNVGGGLQGNAVLRFDATKVAAVRPGTAIRFRGVVDSYTPDPYVLTFIIQNPANDIIGLNTNKAGPHNILARAFKGLFHLVRHLA